MSELKAHRFFSLDEVWQDANLGSDYYLKSEADKVIAELEEERRWRKFPDEKPELGDIVLVKFSERTKGHYYPIDIVRWDSSYELGEIEVSHWMQRPSAPKEGE